MKNGASGSTPAEGGFVLVVFLILLLMLSILSVNTMDTGVAEQTMAGNVQFQLKAFNDAETGLVKAEQYIENNINTTFPDFQTAQSITGTTFYPFAGNTNIVIEHLDGVVAVQATGSVVAIPGCGAGATGCLDYYRVSSTGTGVGPSIQTVESTYAKYITYIP